MLILLVGKLILEDTSEWCLFTPSMISPKFNMNSTLFLLELLLLCEFHVAMAYL